VSKNFDPSPHLDALSARFQNRGAAAKSDPTVAKLKPTAPVGPVMTTRSWYLPETTADALTSAADDLRQTVPALSKAEALTALIEHAVADRAAVAQRLLAARHPPLDARTRADSPS
jgi:hypothetical protein